MYFLQVHPTLLGLKVSLSTPMDTLMGRCVSAFFRRIRYELGANCYLSKPGNLSEFVSTVQLIGTFFGCCEPVSKGERWTIQKPTYC